MSLFFWIVLVLSICGGKASANNENAVFLWRIFKYNIWWSVFIGTKADETGLFWNYFARKTYVIKKESTSSNIKAGKERLIMFANNNAKGTQKHKLLTIRKSNKPSKSNKPNLKTTIILTIIYRSNEHAWMT